SSPLPSLAIAGKSGPSSGIRLAHRCIPLPEALLMPPLRRAAWVASALALIGLFSVRTSAVPGAEPARRPIEFIENRGQWDPRINFVARYHSMTAAVEQATLTLRPDADPTAAISLTFEGASTGAVP